MALVTLSSGKRRTLSLGILPAGALVAGVPVWTVLPVGGATLFPVANGFTCDVLNVAPGLQTVTASAVPQGGTVPLTVSQDIQTLAPVATSLTIAVGPEF